MAAASPAAVPESVSTTSLAAVLPGPTPSKVCMVVITVTNIIGVIIFVIIIIVIALLIAIIIERQHKWHGNGIATFCCTLVFANTSVNINGTYRGLATMAIRAGAVGTRH